MTFTGDIGYTECIDLFETPIMMPVALWLLNVVVRVKRTLPNLFYNTIPNPADGDL